MKSDLERLLEGSNVIERQKKVIAAQAASITLLEARLRLVEAKLARAHRFDLSQPTPALLRKQAG